MHTSDASNERRTAWAHAALLTLLCLVCFFPGLDSHGVTNWQEGQRLMVARDMQLRGEWLVPTSHGQPYIAKPPMIYWAQLALAGVLGHTVELWHLRLVVALAGLLGVLLSYAAARELLTPDAPTPAGRRSAASAAAWSAALLATGILYVRAARIGELDILLIPFVSCAVWAVARAFRTHRRHRRTNLPAVILAALATAGAVMTKDPGLLYVALAAYGGIALWHAFTRDRLDLAFLPRRTLPDLVPAPEHSTAATTLGGVLGFTALALPCALNVSKPAEILSPLLLGAIGVWLGVTLARLAHPRRAMAFIVACSRTHPILVLGAPAAARIAWGYAVANRVGADEVSKLARAEADDNIRPFVAEAGLNNLETLLFGLGIGSVLAIIGAFALLRLRPRLTPGGAIIAAWILLSLIVFSVLGKGVQRYLTPMWPAWAMLAGWVVALWLTDRPFRTRRGVWLALLLSLLALIQGVQYGWLRDRLNAKRSPRDLVTALLARDADLPIYAFEYTSPALDYYARRRVEVIGDTRALASMYAGQARTLEELRRSLANDGPAILIYRDGLIPGIDLPPAADRLRAAGLALEAIDPAPAFQIDNGRTTMRAAIIRLSNNATAP